MGNGRDYVHLVVPREMGQAFADFIKRSTAPGSRPTVEGDNDVDETDIKEGQKVFDGLLTDLSNELKGRSPDLFLQKLDAESLFRFREYRSVLTR